MRKNRLTQSFLLWTTVLSSCLLLGGPLPATEAQVTTNITSSGLGTVVTPSGNVTTITGGTRPGNGPNLFHSFGSFSVGEGNTANFSNNLGLPTANILSRVTGGQVSNINGTLQTTNFGGANLWLINPAGVIFGPSASLNVGGSFNVSTADYLKMTDGGIFYASLAKQSTLTIAPVAAFGFLGPSPGKIAVNGSTLSVGSTPSLADGTTLALVGGEVSIVGGNLQARSSGSPVNPSLGRIALGSVASSGEVLIDLNSLSTLNPVSSPVKPILTAQDGGSTGTVEVLQGSTLNVSAPGPPPGRAGDIQIISGRFVLADGSRVLATSPLERTSGRIAIDAKNSALVTGNSRIDVSNVAEGNIGRIDVTGGSLQVENSVITASGLGATETQGAMFFNVKSLTLLNGGRIENVGAELRNASNPPNIKVDATDSVVISGRNANGVPSSLSSRSVRQAQGPIQVSTQALVIRDGGLIDSSTSGMGGGPPTNGIFVNAGNVSLTGGGQIRSNIEGLLGQGGFIRIDAKDTIAISGRDNIAGLSGVFSSATSTDVTSVGIGGSVALTARQIALNDGGTIQAFSAGKGNAGAITLVATDSFRSKSGTVITEARQAEGGDITLQVGRLVHLKDSLISALVREGAGSGGNVTIDPNFVVLSNSQIVASAKNGNGGNITIQSGVFLASPTSHLIATSETGVSGEVSIQAPTRVLSGTLVPLKQGLVQVAISGNRCATASDGQFSSFVQVARDTMPPEPGSLVSSPLWLEEVARESGAVKGSSLMTRRLGLGDRTLGAIPVVIGCGS